MLKQGYQMIIATAIGFVLNDLCLPFTIQVRGNLTKLKTDKNSK